MSNTVAPRVGAWIETAFALLVLCVCMSHPVWVRGLKHGVKILVHLGIVSYPVWVRGLKQIMV